MITETERQRLSKLPAAEHQSAIQAQIDRIHRACHTGSTDIPAIDDACERIHLILNIDKQTNGADKPSKPLPITASPPLAPTRHS